MPGGIGYKVTLNFKMRFWVLTLKIAFSLEIKGFCGYNNVIKKRLKNPMGEQAYWFFAPLFSISGIKFPISDASGRMFKSIFPMDF